MTLADVQSIINYESGTYFCETDHGFEIWLFELTESDLYVVIDKFDNTKIALAYWEEQR